MRALCTALLVLVAASCSSKQPRRPQPDLHVTVLESVNGAMPQDYQGGVRYHLEVVCEGGSYGELLAGDVLGTSRLQVDLNGATCPSGPTRVQYAVMVNWMRCAPTDGLVEIDPAAPKLAITVNCDS